MKLLILSLLFFGILMVVIGYINQLHKCPPPKIEYRYIPRTFKQEQDNPVKVSQLFSNMFEEPSPWIAGFKLSDNTPHNKQINRYFISQA